MSKQEIVNNIENALEKEKSNRARNSMGVSESFYNAYYMVGCCFEKTELLKMNENELSNLVKLAEFAAESFY